MSNYVPSQTPGTFATLFTGSIIASALVLQPVAQDDIKNLTGYYWNASPSTHQPYSYEAKDNINSFENTIIDFYSSLSSKQEPLGSEFEKILYDNLWDLYQN